MRERARERRKEGGREGGREGDVVLSQVFVGTHTPAAAAATICRRERPRRLTNFFFFVLRRKKQEGRYSMPRTEVRCVQLRAVQQWDMGGGEGGTMICETELLRTELGA